MQGSIADIQEQLKKDEKVRKSIEAKVPWNTFVWAVSVLTLMIASGGAVSLAAQAKANEAIERISAVEGDIKAIDVKIDSMAKDISWIRDQMEKQR